MDQTPLTLPKSFEAVWRRVQESKKGRSAPLMPGRERKSSSVRFISPGGGRGKTP